MLPCKDCGYQKNIPGDCHIKCTYDWGLSGKDRPRNSHGGRWGVRTCPSCGGVIGRDCFNPDECAWITQSMQANEAAEIAMARLRSESQKDEIESLRQRLAAAEADLSSLRTSIQQWRVSAHSPTPDDPFRKIDCAIIDVGYADKCIVVEARAAGGRDNV
jgi:hypothetical protein